MHCYYPSQSDQFHPKSSTINPAPERNITCKMKWKYKNKFCEIHKKQYYVSMLGNVTNGYVRNTKWIIGSELFWICNMFLC